MSSKFIITSLITTAFGVFVGYSAMSWSQQENSPDYSERRIAAAPILKLGADQISRDYYDIKIINENIASKNSDPSILKVIVSAKKDLPTGLQYQWQLHKDMTTTDVLTGQLDTLAAGQKKEFTLRVIGFSKEFNSHINFIVLGQIGNHNLRRSVITSSRPEDSFEYVVEQAALAEKKTGKVLKLSNGKSTKSKFDPAKIIK
jgi:hypothetical protein